MKKQRKKPPLTNKQISDAGMAFVLIMLLLSLFLSTRIFLVIATVSLVINMSLPKTFYPFAVVWYPFSKFIGKVISSILLTVIYIVLVLPTGIVRKILVGDKLRLHDFKKSDSSVFHFRNHTFVPSDVEKPY